MSNIRHSFVCAIAIFSLVCNALTHGEYDSDGFNEIFQLIKARLNLVREIALNEIVEGKDFEANEFDVNGMELPIPVRNKEEFVGFARQFFADDHEANRVLFEEYKRHLTPNDSGNSDDVSREEAINNADKLAERLDKLNTEMLMSLAKFNDKRLDAKCSARVKHEIYTFGKIQSGMTAQRANAMAKTLPNNHGIVDAKNYAFCLNLSHLCAQPIECNMITNEIDVHQ